MSSSAPSYEDTLRHHKLTGDDLEVKCPEEFLRHVATWTNYEEWRKTDLGVDKATVEAIKNQTTDDEGKCRDLLERWRQRLGHNATYSRLVRCFIDSRRADLADKVCEKKKCGAADSGGKPDSPGDVKNFPSVAPETAQDPTTSVGRDIAATPAVEATRSVQKPPPHNRETSRGSVSGCVPSNSAQEQNLGNESSSLVTNVPPLSAAAGDLHRADTPPLFINTLLEKLLEQSATTTALIYQLVRERKTDEASETKENEKKAELTKKEQMIDRLMSHVEGVMELLKKKQATCQQLSDELKKTKDDLEEAETASQRSHKKWSATSQRIQQRVKQLQRDMDNKDEKIKATLQEQQCILLIAEEQKRQKRLIRWITFVFLSVIYTLIVIMVLVVPQYCMSY